MWEVLKVVGNNIKTDRCEVPGGWIVRTFKSNEYGNTVEQSFVSDPNHRWKMNPEESSEPEIGERKKKRLPAAKQGRH